MKKIVNNQRGITLVEILAAVVIIGFLSILILNVQVESSDQYNKQLSKNQQLNEVSYVLKVITKELRNANFITLNDEKQEPLSGNTVYTGIDIDGTQYQLDTSSKIITRNGNIFANNIEDFYVKENGNEISIRIISTNGKKIDTTITVRGEK